MFLTEGDVSKLGPKRIKVCPKLETDADREALWNNMDVIDCFATDHAPHLPEEKDSDNPPPGFPGLETALPLLLTAVNEGRLSLEDIVAKYYTNPRRIFNIPEQPDTYIEVDLDCVWKIPEALPNSKSKWTPFANRTVTGKVLRVVLRGETAYLDGKVLSPIGKGKDVRKIAPSASVSSPSPLSKTPTKPIMAPASTAERADPTTLVSAKEQPVVAPRTDKLLTSLGKLFVTRYPKLI